MNECGSTLEAPSPPTLSPRWGEGILLWRPSTCSGRTILNFGATSEACGHAPLQARHVTGISCTACGGRGWSRGRAPGRRPREAGISQECRSEAVEAEAGHLLLPKMQRVMRLLASEDDAGVRGTRCSSECNGSSVRQKAHGPLQHAEQWAPRERIGRRSRYSWVIQAWPARCPCRSRRKECGRSYHHWLNSVANSSGCGLIPTEA